MNIVSTKLLWPLVAIASLLALPVVADQRLAPPVVPDINPADDIVEVVLRAREAMVNFGSAETEVWTYNGMLPGPTIETDIGDTLIVHFYNELPEPTTIHWHGVELPASMDGTPLTQDPVPPGGYFRYEFKLNRAATYWYHPHVRSNVQVEKGLYGALVVRDRKEDKSFNLPVPGREHVLVLDDILLDSDGQVAEPFPTDPLENAEMQVNGRMGNVLLVNGEVEPTAILRHGRPHRFRVINASNSRFMRLSLSGGHSMWRIGGDAGLAPQSREVTHIPMIHGEGHGHGHSGFMYSDPDPGRGILLTPGERADLVFTPTGNDEEVLLEWHDSPRGRHTAEYDGSMIRFGHDHMDGKLPKATLARFQIKRSGRQPAEAFIPPHNLRPVASLEVTDATPKLPVRFGHTMPDADGNVTFFVAMKNGMGVPFSQLIPDDAPKVTPNETRVIEVVNMTGGDHNFHLHGFMFQHLETQYVDDEHHANNRTVAPESSEFRDTILIGRRPGHTPGKSRTIVRLAVKFDDRGREGQIYAAGKEFDGTPGGWLYHCHLLEHSARGMMGFIQVVAEL
jgi:FtsP/CotA-like multicopper oxidase with cupredoxin domain